MIESTSFLWSQETDDLHVVKQMNNFFDKHRTYEYLNSHADFGFDKENLPYTELIVIYETN